VRVQAVGVVAVLMLQASCERPAPPAPVLSADGGAAEDGGSDPDGGADSDGGAEDAGSPGPPTWYRDVRPITLLRCQGCHAADGIAPFALETWAQAAPRAEAMAKAVTAGTMPPWQPDPTCGGPFRASRRLTVAELTTLTAWSDAGAPEGNPSEAPTPPDAGQPGLPRVDATLAMAQPYTPSASVTDDSRCFLLDPALAVTQQVTGYRVVPGARAQVHHVVLQVVERTAAQQADAQDSLPGWACFDGTPLSSTVMLGAWAPGAEAVMFPAGGIRLQPQQVLAMQVHYQRGSTAPMADLTTVELMYAREPIVDASFIVLEADGFAIPPMSTGFSYSQSFPNLEGPRRVWGVLPQLHQYGQRITLRGASNACLLDLPSWNFHWQQWYFREQPHPLGLGQRLTLTCEWNNPTAATVRWSEGADGEKCVAYVYSTP
jgi:hypothetical protein